MTHALKTWPEYFELLETGKKTFELRRDDRPFEIGDDIILQEWLPSGYTGKELSFMIRSHWGSKRRAERDSVDNLVALCRTCHEAAHGIQSRAIKLDLELIIERRRILI